MGNEPGSTLRLFQSFPDLCSGQGRINIDTLRGHVRDVELFKDHAGAGEAFWDVGFCSHNGLKSDIAPCPKSANFGSGAAYSITSLASCCNCEGTSRPSALAVARLITSSNSTGCSIGISAGLAPRSILSTTSAARRHMLGQFGP